MGNPGGPMKRNADVVIAGLADSLKTSMFDVGKLLTATPHIPIAGWAYDKKTHRESIYINKGLLETLADDELMLIVQHEDLHRAGYHEGYQFDDKGLGNAALDVAINKILYMADPDTMVRLCRRIYPEESKNNVVCLGRADLTRAEVPEQYRDLWDEVWGNNKVPNVYTVYFALKSGGDEARETMKKIWGGLPPKKSDTQGQPMPSQGKPNKNSKNKAKGKSDDKPEGNPTPPEAGKGQSGKQADDEQADNASQSGSSDQPEQDQEGDANGDEQQDKEQGADQSDQDEGEDADESEDTEEESDEPSEDESEDEGEEDEPEDESDPEDEEDDDEAVEDGDEDGEEDDDFGDDFGGTNLQLGFFDFTSDQQELEPLFDFSDEEEDPDANNLLRGLGDEVMIEEEPDDPIGTQVFDRSKDTASEVVNKIKAALQDEDDGGFSTTFSQLFGKLQIIPEKTKEDEVTDFLSRLKARGECDGTVANILKKIGTQAGLGVVGSDLTPTGYMMMAAGVSELTGLFWRQTPYENRPQIGCYVDTSPSMGDWAARTCYIIDCLKEDLPATIYGFAGDVYEMATAPFARGDYTRGSSTCFDAVAKHIAESDQEMAVIFTDGESEVHPAYARLLKQSGRRLYTIFCGPESLRYGKTLAAVSEEYVKFDQPGIKAA